MTWKADKNTLYFLPLGGANEIGMNLNVYIYQGKILIVDIGIGFADEHVPGVDLILPDIEFLTARKKDIIGMIITHAHEDHLGAVPYLWEDLECPVYTTPFTEAVLKAKLAGMPRKQNIPVTSIAYDKPLDLGPFSMTFIPLTHSTLEMHAVAIKTDIGTILHTGDWKFDRDPLLGPVSDEASLRKLGKEGILALVCDSTNVFVEGESGSEETVRAHLIDVVAGCKGRVAITTFASNVARISSAMEAARVNGRKVVLAGRSMHRMVESARECGYLEDYPPLASEKEAQSLPKDKVLILCTGCQGESRAATAKIAQGTHPFVRMTPGDTVIFSSREIPGNEKKIGWMQNQLSRQGIDIITSDDHDIHVSGHPARDELTKMYQLIQPKIAIPVHGEPRHIHEHARFARAMQVPEVIEVQNGSLVQLAPGKSSVIQQMDSGYMALDGNSIIPTDSPIIRTRRKLRDDGAVHITMVLDTKKKLVIPPQISAPGLLDEEVDGELLDILRDEIADSLADANRHRKDNAAILETIRINIRRFFKKEIAKQPIITLHIAHTT